MDRAFVYDELARRVRVMTNSEERPTFLRYELALYEKLSALTDAVVNGMIDRNRADQLLNWYIDSLNPKNSVVRF